MFAIRWKYEHFAQNRVTTKLFAQRYKSAEFARKIAADTFWEHSTNGILIARVSAEVVSANNRNQHKILT